MQQTHIAPTRSLDQRMVALKKANTIRTTRAEWKRDVKRREVDALDVLFDPPAEFETMKVLDVLMAMPKCGRVKANKVLQVARVSSSKTLVGLSARQRRELVSMLPRSR